ncbi:uncharacterized protein DEA37_0001616 [Paragonimus westermani]|uniref:Uncharacterized protein n=1 Tax=Paragonimus westermani TaxID=34504 RepID=A0A5J4NA94_9TREM|nr:uncharacterized protein DEA37_0001616 [Paragonimus westermani]
MFNAAEVLVARPATDCDQKPECSDSEANEETDSDAPVLLESPIDLAWLGKYSIDHCRACAQAAHSHTLVTLGRVQLERTFDRIANSACCNMPFAGSPSSSKETEKLRRQLERACEEIRSETGKRCGEGRQLAQTLKDVQQTIQEEEKLVTLTHVQLETLREELSEASVLPLQHTKEADKLRKQKEEAERIRDESIAEADQLKVEMETLEACRVQLDVESAKLGASFQPAAAVSYRITRSSFQKPRPW